MDNDNIKIEKNIPFSRANTRSGLKYPFDKMEVGDSFFIQPKNGRSPQSLASQLLGQAKGWAVRHNGDVLFKSTCIDGGVRIWRVK